MTTTQKIKAIKETDILPGSYFPSRYYPHTLATENPQLVITLFKEHVALWLEWYPQDAESEHYANLKRVQNLIEGQG